SAYCKRRDLGPAALWHGLLTVPRRLTEGLHEPNSSATPPWRHSVSGCGGRRDGGARSVVPKLRHGKCRRSPMETTPLCGRDPPCSAECDRDRERTRPHLRCTGRELDTGRTRRRGYARVGKHRQESTQSHRSPAAYLPGGVR